VRRVVGDGDVTVTGDPPPPPPPNDDAWKGLGQEDGHGLFVLVDIVDENFRVPVGGRCLAGRT